MEIQSPGLNFHITPPLLCVGFMQNSSGPSLLREGFFLPGQEVGRGYHGDKALVLCLMECDSRESLMDPRLRALLDHREQQAP